MAGKNKVSVIIPIFKVRDFIERCAVSLFEQTLKEVEYIFVDDASPDDSIKVLKSCIERYPERQARTTILTHEHNQGLPAARNTGLAAASGEYVFHCDSDDYVERNMLEEMYEAAKAKDADMAYCDFYLTFEKNERLNLTLIIKASVYLLCHGPPPQIYWVCLFSAALAAMERRTA